MTKLIVSRNQSMHSYRGRFDIISEYNYNCICNYAILCHELRAKHAASCSNIVDKLCKMLRKNLRMCCGLFYDLQWKSGFYVLILWIKLILHRTVEKFYTSFSAIVFLCKILLLHSFHIAYYYNYYFY